jgi:hypothetical protein
MDPRRLTQLLSARDFAALEAALSLAPLDGLPDWWRELSPLDRLVAFKLLDAPRALEFYGRLSFKEKYFLLCGFPLQSIAPVLEDLPPGQKRRFVQLPREFYDRMFRQLVSERVDMTISPGIN